MISSLPYAARVQVLLSRAPARGRTLEAVWSLHRLLLAHMDASQRVSEDPVWRSRTTALEDQLFGACIDGLTGVHEALRSARTIEEARWLQQVRVQYWRLGYALARDESEIALVEQRAG